MLLAYNLSNSSSLLSFFPAQPILAGPVFLKAFIGGLFYSFVLCRVEIFVTVHRGMQYVEYTAQSCKSSAALQMCIVGTTGYSPLYGRAFRPCAGKLLQIFC